jgi:hypothetical protein
MKWRGIDCPECSPGTKTGHQEYFPVPDDRSRRIRRVFRGQYLFGGDGQRGFSHGSVLDTSSVRPNTYQEDAASAAEGTNELEASRSSRKRAWENLQEIRWVLKDSAGMELAPPARKTIDLEGRLIKDGVRKAIRDRQDALHELVQAIHDYRKLFESKPLLQGQDYAHAVHELSTAVDRAEGLLLQ